MKDETPSLSGFGADSFIEVISGMGIAFMVICTRSKLQSPVSQFEITALRMTGTSFFLLSLSLLAAAAINLIYHMKSETTFWGIIISLVSIAVMYWLMISKKNIGRKLHSEPILADANCTKVCIYMSAVLLVSSLFYELTSFTYADIIGTGRLVYFSVNEGIESFRKAAGKAEEGRK